MDNESLRKELTEKNIKLTNALSKLDEKDNELLQINGRF
jgi:hypothetical protein